MSKISGCDCWWFRNPGNSPVEVGSLSHCLQGLIHLRWLFGISSINGITEFHRISGWKNEVTNWLHVCETYMVLLHHAVVPLEKHVKNIFIAGTLRPFSADQLWHSSKETWTRENGVPPRLPLECHVESDLDLLIIFASQVNSNDFEISYLWICTFCGTRVSLALTLKQRLKNHRRCSIATPIVPEDLTPTCQLTRTHGFACAYANLMRTVRGDVRLFISSTNNQ